MASDDFSVQGVDVALNDAAGSVLENGAAVETPINSG
jgi:hypothetical protein